jgi:hypothetical protein
MKNNIIKIVMILICIGIVGVGIMLMGSRKSKKIEDKGIDFVTNKTEDATELFHEIMNVDYENSYPQGVSEVMNLYLKTVEILYGNMIENEDIMEQILEKQRKMYSTELIELNNFEKQYEVLKYSLNELKAKEIILITNQIESIEQSSIDPTTWIIEISEQYTNIGTVKKRYYLKQDLTNDKWKISNWERI